jgi:methionyl-tRNA formyltransferase
MDEKMDHGPILRNSKFEIRNSKITYNELTNELADLGADLLIKTLPNWIEGKIKPRPQDHSKATFTKIIKKEDGKIDWNKSAEEIERTIGALDPWPGTFASLKLKNKSPALKGRGSPNKVGRQKLKVLKAEALKENADKNVGEVFLTDDKKLAVQTGNGILILKQVQLEGKRVMPAKDFLNGHPRIIGAILK